MPLLYLGGFMFKYFIAWLFGVPFIVLLLIWLFAH